MGKVGKVSFNLSAVAAERRLTQAVDTAQRLKSVAEAAEKRVTELEVERDALRAELAKRIEFWECPKCAFRMSAEHSHADGSYSCPNCAEQALHAEVAKLRETLRDANRVLIHHHLANYVVEDVCSICESSRIFYKIDAALADAGKGK